MGLFQFTFFFPFLFLQALSVSHMVVFFCLLPVLSPPLPIINNRSTRDLLFLGFRRYHPSSSFCAPPLFSYYHPTFVFLFYLL